MCVFVFGVYYVYAGQHNDARMNLSIALTAAMEGAVIANHVEVISLIKDKVCLIWRTVKNDA